LLDLIATMDAEGGGGSMETSAKCRPRITPDLVRVLLHRHGQNRLDCAHLMCSQDNYSSFCRHDRPLHPGRTRRTHIQFIYWFKPKPSHMQNDRFPIVVKSAKFRSEWFVDDMLRNISSPMTRIRAHTIKYQRDGSMAKSQHRK
jgi:hypothetical protein